LAVVREDLAEGLLRLETLSLKTFDERLGAIT